MLQRTNPSQCSWWLLSPGLLGVAPLLARVCLEAAKSTSEMGNSPYGRCLLP